MAPTQLQIETVADLPVPHGFSSHALTILEERDVKLPSPSQAYFQTVLDSVIGADDICMYQLLISNLFNHTAIFPGSRCSLRTELWNETSEPSTFFARSESNDLAPDWHLLKGEISPHAYANVLVGRLSFNTLAKHQLRELITSTTSDTLFSEIHDLRGPTYHHWQKDDAICRNCLTEIAREHLHLWVSHRNNGKSCCGR
jgi:hypothetical protein